MPEAPAAREAVSTAPAARTVSTATPATQGLRASGSAITGPTPLATHAPTAAGSPTTPMISKMTHVCREGPPQFRKSLRGVVRTRRHCLSQVFVRISGKPADPTTCRLLKRTQRTPGAPRAAVDDLIARKRHLARQRPSARSAKGVALRHYRGSGRTSATTSPISMAAPGSRPSVVRMCSPSFAKLE